MIRQNTKLGSQNQLPVLVIAGDAELCHAQNFTLHLQVVAAT
jgi:hypothetical protein